MRRFPVWLAAGVLAGAMAAPRTILAQGYGVYEHGTCAMARAGAAVASPCDDASTIFFNPAGLALADHQLVSAGGTLIAPSGQFENDNTGIKTRMNRRVYPVPHFYFQHPISKRIVAGFGFFVPYGLETDWPENFEGRFLGYKSLVQGFYLQPTVAAKITDRIMVGAGVDFTYLKVGLHQHLDLAPQALPPPAPPGATFANLGIQQRTDFANADLVGHGWNLGYNLGILWQATDKFSLGVRFLSRQKVEINDADVTFTQIATNDTLAMGNPFGVPPGTTLDQVLASRFLDDSTLGKQSGQTSLTLPEQLVLGAAYQLTPRFKLLFDYQHTNWKVFDRLVIDFDHAGQRTIVEDYKASDGVRLGGEYAWTSNTTVRAGFLTHTEAAPDQTVTPNLPEGPRSEFTLGLGTRLTNSLRVDLAYQYIDQADRRGRTTDGGQAVPTTAVNNGLYTFHAHLFGATFALAF
ncbi:MAG: outer membrane protein transport protein [Gemmatimonadota bacterium]